MSQRRSSSSASFASASTNSSMSAASSANPSPSSSPSRPNQPQHQAISICPFGRAPCTSSTSTADGSAASSQQSSPSKCSQGKVATNAQNCTKSTLSLCCPLLRPPSSSSGNSASSIVQIFTTKTSSRNNENDGAERRNCCCCLHCINFCCPSSSESTAAAETTQQLPFSYRRRRRRNAENGENQATKNGRFWGNNGRLRQALPILLLQFLWILPYICVANYLERCLLPLRIYCYTDPDLLQVHRPLRSSPDQCAAHFFARPRNRRSRGQETSVDAFPPTACHLNNTMDVLIQPWRIRMDDPELRRVIVIRSAPRAHEYREFIRSSWKSAVERVNGPVIFVSGRDGTELAVESAEHGDILQLDFEDSYRNLTMKMMGIYRFFIERSRVQQIAVINDDTIVNASALETLFDEIGMQSMMPQNGRYLIGKVSRGYPRLVFPWLPWYVPAELFPHKCYPPFVQGSSFIISREAAAEVLHHVCAFPWRHIHLDDILMGIATNCLGISNLHRDGFDVGHSLESFTVFHYQFSRHSADTLMQMFNQIRHALM